MKIIIISNNFYLKKKKLVRLFPFLKKRKKKVGKVITKQNKNPVLYFQS